MVTEDTGLAGGDGLLNKNGTGSLTCVRDDSLVRVWVLKVQGWEMVTGLLVHADYADFADLKDKKIRSEKEARWARHEIR